ncbi:hypothetical protein K1T71_006526 [Dendrolimus kikuchii]|uniref:Uncharacterized protein n=1 Tax=Dendrolimus kikuchii TaxID=765133 RepID=A0ACC1D144_9NEOP|nr:hypothetical protein K1T71_006526 [Dendrolimus kikuchii]
MTGHQPIIIVSAYLKCQKPILEDDLNALFSLGPAVIIAGDLNCKHPSWNCPIENPKGRELLRLSDRLLFGILAPLTPTRYPDRPDVQYPSVLDIALLKGVSLQFRSIETRDDIDSDHLPVVLQLGPPTDSTPPTKPVIDWAKVRDLLATTSSPDLDRIPDPINSAQDNDVAIEALTSHLQNVVRESTRQVPLEDHRLPLPDDVRDLMRDKRAAFRAYGSFPSPDNKAQYRALQRQVRLRVQEVRNQRWDRLLEEISPTHQAYWQLARSLKAETLSSMPPLERPDNTKAFDDDEKAECLAESLELQCSPNIANNDPSHLSEVDAEVEYRSSLPAETTLEPVTVEEVQDFIKALKPRKAPGNDGISHKLLKILPAQLILIMVSIFNAAINNCQFPKTWKEAEVIGIRKPGKPASKPSSYRPISLLSSLGKLYERVLLTRLRDFAFSNNLIPPEQFGFRARHSCPQQVLRITEHVLSHFQRSGRRFWPTGAVFFDVAKAFDKVWHNGLIYKLYQLGVPDRLVLILRDFLKDRRFRFRVEGTRSSSHSISAGVPQGSALSPLLFSLYTSDMPRHPHTELALYADDTAIFISDPSRYRICSHLNAAIKELGDWFRRWRIEVNPEKSAAIMFSRRSLSPNTRPTNQLMPIKLYDGVIPWVNEVKYLGVTLDKGLYFHKHTRAAGNRAYWILGRLYPLICKKSKMSLRNKVTLYKTCIRPIMTYASVVFGHASETNIWRLQRIQNHFMRAAVDAPRYMRLADLHRDLELPSIKDYIVTLSRRFFDLAPHHPNPLVTETVNYKPTPNAPMRNRRPRNVLIDEPDKITRLLAIMNPPRLRTSAWHNRRRQNRRRRAPGSDPLTQR